MLHNIGFVWTGLILILHALLNKVKNETTDHENKAGTLFDDFVYGLLKHHIYTKYNQLFNLYYWARQLEVAI
jgi:hypothetical protein